MKYEKTINDILKKINSEIEIVSPGDMLETCKTQFILRKNNYVIDGIRMTIPSASSQQWKKILIKEKSPLLKAFKDITRGDVLVVEKIEKNKVYVRNISLKDEYSNPFVIDKLQILKKEFNVIKRRSLELSRTIDKL
jgi:hypothetical protein